MTLLEPGYKVYVYSQSGAVDFILCYYWIVSWYNPFYSFLKNTQSITPTNQHADNQIQVLQQRDNDNLTPQIKRRMMFAGFFLI